MSGADRDVPFQVMALPSVFTAMQKLDDTQERA